MVFRLLVLTIFLECALGPSGLKEIVLGRQLLAFWHWALSKEAV